VFAAADGQSLVFDPATVDTAAVARVQARVRRRVLAAYRRHGVLDEHEHGTVEKQTNTGQSKKSESRKGWSAERWRE